jgi:hypothetical protein
MGRMLKSCARLAACAFVVWVAACSTVAPTPASVPPTSPPTAPPTQAVTSPLPTSAVASPVTGGPRFVSTRYGYSLAYPTGWNVVPGSQPWPIGAAQLETMADAFNEPSPGAASLVVTSQPLDKGQDAAAWFAAYLAGAPHPECFPPRHDWEAVTVDGHAGGIHGGLALCNFTEAVVEDGGRMYVITGYANRFGPSGQVFDRASFNAILDGVELNPAAAVDAP